MLHIQRLAIYKIIQEGDSTSHCIRITKFQSCVTHYIFSLNPLKLGRGAASWWVVFYRRIPGP